MAEDDRKKRKYRSTKQGLTSPMADIATVGKHPGRALQPSAVAKSPGEMYGPYRGPFNDPKYHTRGEPAKTIMNMDRFPSAAPAARAAGRFMQRGMDPAQPGPQDLVPRQNLVPSQDFLPESMRPGPYKRTPVVDRSAGSSSFGNRMDAVAGRALDALAPSHYTGPAGMQASPRTRTEIDALKALPQKIQSGLGAIGREVAQGARATRDWAGWLAGNVQSAQKDVARVQGPSPGQPEEGPQKTADIQQRVDAAVGRTPAPGAPGSSKQMPGEALRQLRGKIDEQMPEGERGRPKLYAKSGEYQLDPYTPTKQEMEAPIHVIKGNQESWWDPKTERRFATLGEAFRGEEAGVTAERAKAAAKRQFELEKAKITATPFTHVKGQELIDPDSPPVAPQGYAFDKRTGTAVPLGTPGQDPVAAAIASATTKKQITDALTPLSEKERKRAVGMLTKEQIDAYRSGK